MAKNSAPPAVPEVDRNEAKFVAGPSDQRPTGLPKDSIYYEVDTRKRYRHQGSEIWVYLDTVE